MNLFENISMDRFFSSLQYMWKGMLAIFIVIGAIILATVLINAICNRREEKKKLREEQQGQ